jgi:signal transduction histidine kinase
MDGVMSSGPDVFRRQQRWLVAGYTVVMASLLCLFGLIGYQSTRAALLTAADTDADAALQDVLPALRTTSALGVDGALFAEESLEMAEERGMALAQVFDARGRLVHEYRPKAASLAPMGPDREVVATTMPLRVLRRPLIVGGERLGTLVVAVHWSTPARSLAEVARFLSLAVLVGTLGAAVLAYWLAAWTMQPLRAASIRQRHFLADAAHELRTPVALIQSQLDLASGDASPDLAGIARSARRLGVLIDDLLTLARLDADAWQPDARPFRLDDLLDEVLDDYQGPAMAAGVAVAAEALPAVTVLADPEQLRRLFTNLLDNALRHTPAGGRVAVRCTVRPEAVVVQVADTGKGIPADALGRVFDRFFRLNDQVEGRRAGSGLGLAIAKAVAEGHGGRLSVASTLGQGTTFDLRLPPAVT